MSSGTVRGFSGGVEELYRSRTQLPNRPGLGVWRRILGHMCREAHVRLSNSNSAGRTTEDLVLVLRKKLLELANECLCAQVSVYGEVNTHDRSEPEPAVGRQPIGSPPSPGLVRGGPAEPRGCRAPHNPIVSASAYLAFVECAGDGLF